MSLETLLQDIERSDMGVIAAQKKYSQKDALLFLPNTARTLNYYKQEGLLPERPKKAKYSFEELVWIRIVAELKNMNIDHERIQKLKDYLFAPVDDVLLDTVLEVNKGHLEENLTPFLKQIPEELQAEFKKMLLKLMSNKKHLARKVKHNLRFWLMSIIQGKVAAELRLYTDGQVEFHLNNIESTYIPSFKTYVAVSLTQILSFYLSKDYIDPALTQKILNKDELLVLQYMRERKYKTIEITFKKEKIDLIKLASEGQVDPAQRLYEFMLAGAYDDITIKREAGKIMSISTTTKIKPNIPPSIRPRK